MIASAADVHRHCRALGITPPATAGQVRQAFLDLAQVWHPDRFPNNRRLQRIAEDRMRELNEAYEALRNGVDALPEEPHAPKQTPPQRPTRKKRFTPLRTFRMPAVLGSTWGHALVAAGIVVTFIVGTVWLLDALPPIATPFGSMYRPSAKAAMEGAINDLTARATSLSTDPQPGVAVPVPVVPAHESSHPPSLKSSRRTRKEPDRTVEVTNGSELIVPRTRPGAGVIRVRNAQQHDAAVMLADEKTPAAALRILYIGAGREATLGDIGPGVYVLQVQFGRGWRPAALEFGEPGPRMAALGPFSFMQIHGDSGVRGNEYQIVLKPRNPDRTERSN